MPHRPWRTRSWPGRGPLATSTSNSRTWLTEEQAAVALRLDDTATLTRLDMTGSRLCPRWPSSSLSNREAAEWAIQARTKLSRGG